jgi:hypothetical protein
MLQLHLLGVHHVLTRSEEFRRLGKFPDMIVKSIQYRRHLCENEGLCLTQDVGRVPADHVEPEPLPDRAFSAHVVVPRLEKNPQVMKIWLVRTSLGRCPDSAVDDSSAGYRQEIDPTDIAKDWLPDR